MTIAMKEKARICDKMPSATLNLVSEARASSTTDDDASSSRDDVQVSFRKLVLKYTLISIRKNSGIFIWN
jgi:hypothetical protein